uniref:Mediator of DNA damage checkpoint protein 1 n=1 Tax=Sander lucioperca TaxID=283035 RepID=A0A8D0AIX4_SANLU
MDATQMICDSILESDEEENEEENKNKRGPPLAKLCILKNEHIPETELPLFLGDNVLGRDPNTCTLPLPAPSISKQHATICVSVYRRRGCHSEVDVEALVWDLGSMNGTHKGRLKLTPNVRYALSERDSLVVADIPCQYVRDMRTPVSRNSGVKAPLPDASGEKGGDTITGSKKCVNGGTKTRVSSPDQEDTRKNPIRTSCLSFEQTPTQPQGTLVPESGSDSDGERGDRRRKALVSDSDSFKSSPTCSTFLSPPNKIVPESEDESPITPSSSTKNRPYRHVSFSKEETDLDVGRQQPMKKKALAVVDDSEEEEEREEERAALRGRKSEESGQHVPVKQESNVNDYASDQVPKSVPSFADHTNPPHVISVIRPEGITMDSDTDVDDDDAPVSDAATKAKPTSIQSTHTADSAPSTQLKDFHLDSDTDVDEEEEKKRGTNNTYSDTDDEAIPAPAISEPSMVSAVTESCTAADARADLGILSDSDTDVEDGSPLVIPVAVPTLSVGPGTTSEALQSESEADTDVNPDDLRVDSDTDVEDEKVDFGEACEGQIPSLPRENTPRFLVPLKQNCSTPIQVSGKQSIKHGEAAQPQKSHLSEAVSLAETQPVRISDDEESDDELIPGPRIRKAKPLQFGEEQTQTLPNSELSAVETQPMGTYDSEQSDEEDSSPGPRKRTARPQQIQEEETQPLTNSESSTVETQPLETKTGLQPQRGKGRQSEAGTSGTTIRGTRGTRARLREAEEQAESSEPPKRRTRGKNKALPTTRGRRGKARPDEEESEEEEEVVQAKGAGGKKSMREQKDNEDKEERLQTGRNKHTEKANLMKEEEERRKAKLERERKEKEEKERFERKEQEENERLECEKAEREEKERKEKERIEKERKEQEEQERLQAIIAERLRLAQEGAEKDRIDGERKEQEEKKRADKAQKEKEEQLGRERKEKEEKESLEREKAKREEKERLKREKAEREEKERLEKEKAEREEKERLEREKKERIEKRKEQGEKESLQMAKREQEERLERERKEQEHQARLEREERERMEKEKQEKEQEENKPKTPARSRRAARTTAAPCTTEPEQDSTVSANDDVPARRTRSRSNSSNSVSSERSASSVNTQGSRGRGRGRGAKGTSGPPQAAVVRSSNRRRTVAAEATRVTSNEVSPQGVRSRSNSTNSLNSEISSCSVSSQGRGRGGRQRGRGRKTEAEPHSIPPVNSQSELNLAPKPTARGRKSRKEEESSNEVPHEDENEKADSQQASTTRGRRRANENSSEPAAADEQGPSNQEERCVLFTGVVDEVGERVLARLGGSMAKGVADMNCLVTDKVRRTVKFLCAVAKGVPIVTTHWLEKSGKAGSFLSPNDFVVKDLEQEKKFNFCLQESLRIASSQSLLQGYEIHVTKSVKPEPVHMKDIISCSGATFLPKLPSSHKPQTVVISCEEDWLLCSPALSASLPVVTAEFILTGILQQKVDLQTHTLSAPRNTLQPAGGRGRSRKKT